MIGSAFTCFELPDEFRHICMHEVISGLFYFVVAVQIAITVLIVPVKIENIVDALQIKCDSFQALSDLTRDRTAVQPADLLEISELGELHAV